MIKGLLFLFISTSLYAQTAPKNFNPATLNQQKPYIPSPQDISPEGFNWVHRDFALILSGSVYEHNFDGEYRADVLKQRLPDLTRYVETLRAIKPEQFAKWSKDNQLAFLINAYHAHVFLAMIAVDFKSLSNKLLTKPDTVKLFGKAYSFKQFVDGEIRSRFDNPRIYLSLFCFEKYCPEMRNRIYNYKNVTGELNVSAVRYVRHPEKNKFDVKSKTVTLTPLFKENEKLILKESKTMVDFLSLFISDKDVSTLLKDPKLKIKFL